MQRIVITLLLLKITYIHSLTKCCGDKSRLIRVDGVFKCTNDSGANDYSGFPKYGIPDDCSGSETCTDLYFGNFVKINCKTSTPKTFDLLTIHKCCPQRMVYDSKSSTCKYIEGVQFELPQTTEDDLLIKIVEFLPKCNGVFVDRVFRNDFIRIEKGVLKIFTKKFNRVEFDLNDICIDSTVDDDFVVRNCQSYDVCSKMLCIKKCCPDGFGYFTMGDLKTLTCQPGYPESFNFDKYLSYKLVTDNLPNYLPNKMFGDKKFAMSYNMTCEYIILPQRYLFHSKGQISKDGTYNFDFINYYSYKSSKYEEGHDYCIENLYNYESDNGTTHVFICYNEELHKKYRLNGRTDWKMNFKIAGIIISVIFTLFTILFGKKRLCTATTPNEPPNSNPVGYNDIYNK